MYKLTRKADLTWIQGHGGPSPNLDMASKRRVYSTRDRWETQKQPQFLEGSDTYVCQYILGRDFSNPHPLRLIQ